MTDDEGSEDSAPPVFELRNVTVRFGEVDVLRDVSVRLCEHRVTVLTGPSGARKTTLLRLCNRLEVPHNGTVRFHGEDVASLDPLVLRRRVGMVFQRPTLFPGTLHQNFEVAGPVEIRACEDALDMVGLPASWLERPGDQLSGGEAQRACLARTLLTEPEVLLLDEPTSSLDEGATRSLERLTGDLVDAGLTLVWVSHDLAQVARIADSSIVLIDGNVMGSERTAAYLSGADHQVKDPGEDGT